ncbi:HpcH/HpaI aldolase/citrate lyase family protein [Bradyrhizobium erythrophlei]|uniref:Citrate lyase subunit beta / citryl-CoA lyase n=1 Tax=Bradyrhizobium erythrophlei TaxID=1437360 RepID=A0A1M5JWE7_9BRAD|nr:CoA ester lyase [Bradyrhizobium erythrophlei]SHG44907.1 citrate lyase subunit beta / citryl-CoA lyase [Bradyrhizobium erythrophlei]
MTQASAHRDLPVWRTLLFVPINVERFVEGAHRRGADAIHLDLEDSVPDAEKDNARRLIETAAIRVRRGGADLVVRINRPLDLAVRDIEACVRPEVDAISVTKVASPSHLQLLDELVSKLEQNRGLPVGRIRFIAMIETADAFFHVRKIASATPRLAALNLGTEDFAMSIGMEPEPEALLYPKQHTLFAARAAGLIPLGFVGSVAEFGDPQKFRDMIHRSRRMGFEGANCIHPGQVTILNEEYSPRPEEVAAAHDLITRNDAAKAEGRGSFAVDGKMVDVPVLLRAERVLTRHAAIEQRNARLCEFATAGAGGAA